ncbi:spore germination protein [Caldisalinibacter kiritimatiensis]|uniref:Stage V sporulation protein AF (SpoVAF) n=1 Tax=Caldisalinibacter kiritimatiensis TaxID=1304284 RepID=R1AXZ4_9FIRM|nr:spore germination protein [Caldisalinibacter kiritimatiensis]EOD01517.1 Stage V sporulation protein AF (SpoVAF) [Caldisalinibacter kiritimatiensis]
MKVSSKFQENIEYLSNKLGLEESFDVIKKDIVIGGKKSAIFFIDGFVKDEVMIWILSILQQVDRDEIVPNTLNKLLNKNIPYIECDYTDNMDDVEFAIMSGSVALFVEGVNECIIIDARTYPARGPEEPDLERVTRGPRDGFVETIVFNTALIRRRIRDPNLRFEMFKVGDRSQTDVVVSYIKDITNTDLINSIKKKLQEIKTDSLLMGEKSLEEFILGRSWNPFPQAKFTERPDVAAAHLLEGHIVVMVDTTPSVMILPVTLFHFTQHAEDYYNNPTVGTYMRWVRFLAITISYVLSALWLLLVFNKEYLPHALKFIGPEKTGEIPLLIQFIVLEIGLDFLRIASIHTPNALTTSLGIIGALLLSDFAVKVGWFIPETVLYGAIVGIGMFATPSIEFSLAIRIFRLILIILTGIFDIYGFTIGILLFVIVLFRTKSFGGINYLWPLIPFNWKALNTVLMRKPIPEVRLRPDFLRVKDNDTSPPNENA